MKSATVIIEGRAVPVTIYTEADAHDNFGDLPPEGFPACPAPKMMPAMSPGTLLRAAIYALACWVVLYVLWRLL